MDVLAYSLGYVKLTLDLDVPFNFFLFVEHYFWVHHQALFGSTFSMYALP